MGHLVCGIVVAGAFSEALAREYDLRPALRRDGLVLFPIDHYWSAAWQARRGGRDTDLELPRGLPVTFPSEGAIAAIVAEVTATDVPLFALLQTDYFGGSGQQWAVVLQGTQATTGTVSVNEALRKLGLDAPAAQDEWDTLGLGGFRSNPDYLDVYPDICEQLGV